MRISPSSYDTARVLAAAGVLAWYRTGEVAGLRGLRRRCYASLRNGRYAAVVITGSGRPARGKRRW